MNGKFLAKWRICSFVCGLVSASVVVHVVAAAAAAAATATEK